MKYYTARQISDYFSLGSPGYVLNFSNMAWDEFTDDIIGIKLQSELGGSKGASLTSFLSSPDYSQTLKYKLIFELNEIMNDYIRTSSIAPPLPEPAVKKALAESANYQDSVILSKSTFNTRITLDYIKQLPSRLEQDLILKNFDSVITKSNTMIDEVFKYIIENTVGEEDLSKHIESKKLRKIVFSRLNLQADKKLDKRVNQLLSSLNNLSDSILEMRNKQSDAHAQGSRRITVTQDEAVLVANSAMIFCEYIFNIYQRNLK
ncbi:abortive infection family protein [Enterococcus faecalis]|uniref:abortive infection family protein n=1 Tax=Enterococcus faecalis TaxID=1351 RepID=UPI0012E1BAF2|nr:abortive infection family protein [Enterococcus faecalis]EGO5016458.1 abortive infection family protein [Enterococcus faecalis]EGO6561329.1 abortive infection family protein [Enterococcus faecalis]EGO7561155.1 abortive infection family protein [Enterococcus faecalis]EGO7742844.1 abortive infection family protein [Enterococcus faecalis]EGO8387387.1 hypothetical protein [Enterococcus faecalis]